MDDNTISEFVIFSLNHICQNYPSTVMLSAAFNPIKANFCSIDGAICPNQGTRFEVKLTAETPPGGPGGPCTMTLVVVLILPTAVSTTHS